MPMFVTCRTCGRRGDYWAGGFTKDDFRAWYCTAPFAEECRARRSEQDRQARVEKKARLARMADERRG